MARYFNNRSSKEIVAFLEEHGFCFDIGHGDDDVYIKNGWKFPVKVTRDQKSTPIGTMIYIVKMSGYSKKEWGKWWIDNGYGE
jgi:hypothetical protein